MNRLEHQIERDLRQIADRATPSPDAWNSILTRIADQDPDTETEIVMLTEATPHSTRRWLPFASAAAAVVVIVGAVVIAFALNDTELRRRANAGARGDDHRRADDGDRLIPRCGRRSRRHVHRAGRLELRRWAVYKAAADPDANHLGIGSVGVNFTQVTNIYADGCQWVLVDPPIGPTVDDLISAWANVPGFNATAAIDITVDGYLGKQIEFTVPDYKEDECTMNKYGLWQVDGPPDHPADSANPTIGRRAPISTTSCGSSTSKVRGRDRRVLLPGHLAAGPSSPRRHPGLHPDRPV